jgi:hypothetical protein
MEVEDGNWLYRSSCYVPDVQLMINKVNMPST